MGWQGVCQLLLFCVVVVPVTAFVDPQNATEAAIQLVTTGLTNVFMFLPVYKSIQTCNYVEGTLGLFACLTSSMYHILQTLEPVMMPMDPETDERVALRFLGGNSLEWHQADNIFGISSFCMVVLQAAQVDHPLWALWLRLFIFCFNATAQCLCPWDERYTVYPILATLVLVILYLFYQRKMPNLLWDHFFYACVFLVGAVFTFVKGLDDNNDPGRFWHGGWHFFGSLFGYYITSAFSPPEVTRYRLSMYQTMSTFGHPTKSVGKTQ
eukprot:GHVS01103928.1.p1 GENE.GHVS01103928.1~~GHVS01103928.1.p1  ORF type:complete len:267 (+),score=34.26 GHVS01103928.1:73-873(+)